MAVSGVAVMMVLVRCCCVISVDSIAAYDVVRVSSLGSGCSMMLRVLKVHGDLLVRARIGRALVGHPRTFRVLKLVAVAAIV